VATAVEHRSQQVRAAVKRPRAKKWLPIVARTGLASRAVIYVMLGVLASLIVANGRPPEQASGSGALAEIAKQPAGPFLLGLLSSGLICYGAWRLSQAIAGLEPAAPDQPSAPKRLGWLATAVVYFVLFGEALTILTGNGTSGGPANHPQSAAATVLSWPGGPVLLGILGSVLAVSAVVLGVWGCVYDYRQTLDGRRAHRWVRTATRISGTVGNVTRAALLALIASYTFQAAIDNAPSRAKSLDQSLEAVVHSPGGPWWIVLAVAGLFSFATYSMLEVFYRRV